MKINEEIDQVIEEMRKAYSTIVDYNMVDNDTVQLLDKNDEVIATISAERLTQYWNKVEGF